MHHQAIAGFLGAAALAHATVTVYAALLHVRSARGAPGGSAHASSTGRGEPAWSGSEVLVFGLLNFAAAIVDAGLAAAELAIERPASLSAALSVAVAGRVLGLALLVHFVALHVRVRLPPRAFVGVYAGAAVLVTASALGLLLRQGEARAVVARVGGVEVEVILAPPGPLAAVLAVCSIAVTVASLAALGRAFLRGRGEALAFLGMTALTVATLYDVIRDLGGVIGPPLAPLGWAVFVNGVMVTSIARFAALRRQLEARARDLKDRARALRRSYEELRAAQDELVRKEQLAAVGELSAVIAHEVRNPLAIIANAVATLRRDGLAPEDRSTLLGILDEESSRLNRLVGDLLRYARPIALERQLVNLREVCERGLALADARLDLSVELVEPEPIERVWADANLVRHVFDNLIDNAIQAMSGGGVLTVTLVNLELDGSRGVEVQIQDTGEGMDTEVRARALDPFFTTRPSGTGLGLAIVARIVDAHGGVLRIKSKAGSGTVMHVFLPRSSESPEPKRPRPERSSSVPPLPPDLRKALGEP